MPLVKFLLRHALLFYFSCALLTAALMVLATGVISQYELVEKGVQIRGVVVEPDCGATFEFQLPVSRGWSDVCGTVGFGPLHERQGRGCGNGSLCSRRSLCKYGRRSRLPFSQ